MRCNSIVTGNISKTLCIKMNFVKKERNQNIISGIDSFRIIYIYIYIYIYINRLPCQKSTITAWDTNSGKVAYCIDDAHTALVKGIVVLSKNSDGDATDYPYLVASASSDGVIRV
ncbi:hypothetical protein Dsin_004784 [Dipteronia sinensis]|uniref:Uncharacterized protein n=1 Tax=Dipteronia sinensis TaxID=43782 RepID=A0AAE0AWI7_9ROSI|nr:hypothetical protein Dsin_004784 [Dipteronia sinensis]